MTLDLVGARILDEDRAKHNVQREGTFNSLGGVLNRASNLFVAFGLKAKLVTSEEVIYLSSLQERITVKSSWKFAYVVVVRRILGMERMVAISNPIYIEA